VCPDRVAAQPRSAAPDDVDLQSAVHPLAALEQGFQAMAWMSWLPGRRCRNQLGFETSWAKFGVKIARSTSLAIPAPPREGANLRTRFDVVGRPCATSDVRG
jgi:hypothetical protein